jgi:ATP/maltotriose-dependent transcriptional regulator MalT
VLQDEAGARDAFLRTKSLNETQLEQSPGDAEGNARLAKISAWLGERDAALNRARRATDLLPETKDSLSGPIMTAVLAEVHAILGDDARAVEILDGLLSRPSFITVQGLKVDPCWDPLRSDLRFQALLNKYQP